MYTLNLDSNFNFPDKIYYKSFIFNGGEIHFTLRDNLTLNTKEEVLITHRVKNSNNIMEIAIANDALKRFGFKKRSLLIPYAPYARQDRVANLGESLSVKVFADIINSCDFEDVIIWDAHSDVITALLNNCTNKKIDEIVYNIIGKNDVKNIVFPDAGAMKKYKYIYLNHLNVISCTKERNTVTGELSDFNLNGTLKEGNTLIIDDICDGGRTFIEISKLIRNLKYRSSSSNLYLYTTHGIYANGIEVLLEQFDKLFCTNSFKDINNRFVEQYKLNNV